MCAHIRLAPPDFHGLSPDAIARQTAATKTPQSAHRVVAVLAQYLLREQVRWLHIKVLVIYPVPPWYDPNKLSHISRFH